MRKGGLNELQAGINRGGRNSHNLRYADDTTLMAENKQELKSLLMRVKEESERASLKLNTKKKTKIMASSPIISWQIEEEKVEVVSYFLFYGSKITSNGDCRNETRCLLLGSKVMTNLDSVLKSGDITLSTKVRMVKAMVFEVVMYSCESWTMKKVGQ